MFNQLINFGIVTLFLTNIWIILYNSILILLNYLFPATVKEQLLRDIAIPNPFKITLYIFLTFLFVLIINFLHNKSLKLNLKDHILIFLRIAILSTLAFLFLNKLGTYPMANDPYPYALRQDKTFYYLIFGIYIGLIGFITTQSTILGKIFAKKKLFLTFYYFFIILLIALFTFEPRFPILGHDYSFFFGPILEIASGKTIYTQIPSQHGFISISIFSFLYKIGLFPLTFLPIFVWGLYMIQYFLIFYIFLKVIKSPAMAIIGLFSVITVNYFSLYLLPAMVPQTGPMRWLPAILTLLIFHRLKKIDDWRLIFFIALSSLWIIDSGIALILSYIFTLWIIFLSKLMTLKRLIISILSLVASLAVIFIIINALHLLSGYQTINLLNLFTSLRKYATIGIAQIPIEAKTYFWIVILIYFGSIIYFFRNKLIHHAGGTKGRGPASAQIWRYSPPVEHLREGISWQNLHDDTILLFSANLSLFSSIYYVGRSHPHNLFHIAILPTLTAFLLLGNIYARIVSTKIKLVAICLLFLTFIFSPALMRKITLTEMLVTKYKKFAAGNIFQPEMDQLLKEKYKKEVALIKNAVKDKEIVILAIDDTYLFYLTKKRNLLDANPQVGIDTVSDLNKAVKRAITICPQTIVADCRIFEKCEDYETFSHGFFVSPLILKTIENRCRIKYSPTECTDKLCIAKSTYQ